jgi:uncharacterized protein YhbP (UPF0306 family)
MNDNEKARKIINENLYMTISVASKQGDPWIANVYFAIDSNYNFYWYSPTNSLHSTLIRENPSIAISIFNSTTVGDYVDAVYIKAKVEEVTNKLEIIKGLTIYGKKMLATGFADTKAQIERFTKQHKDFQGISKLRLYKATPIKVWKLAPSELYNEKYVDSRIEVDLINLLTTTKL